MNLSIRVRLTLLYAILLGFGLIVFGWFLYFTLSRSLIDATDTKIKAVAEIISRTALSPSSALGLPDDFDYILDRFFGIKTSGKFIQIVDQTGKVGARSSSLKDFKIPLSSEAFHNALQGKITYETINIIGRYPIRIITYPVMNRGKLANLIQVGTSIENIKDTLDSLLYILYLGIPLAVILASLLGWLIANRALRPVDEITRTARRIGAENLSERLVVNGPKDEIGRLVETFNEMISRLEVSFNKIKQFTSDASHELRTPLTILKGETEIALKTEDTVEGLKEVLASNLEEVNRMSRIVNDLLMLSRIDRGAERFVMEEVNLEDIVTEKFEQARTLARDKGIEVTLANSTRVAVRGDPVKLRQLILNLLDNAIKYTPEGGMVTISLDKANGNAVLVVSDTGIGINKDALPHIFDRFYRVDKARSRDLGGSGLGLSICKAIVTAHNGDIEVTSRQGKGTTFTVTIPAL